MEVIQSLLAFEHLFEDANAMEVSDPIAVGQFAETNRSTIDLGLNALRFLDEWVVGATGHSYDTSQTTENLKRSSTNNRNLDLVLLWIYHTSASRSTLAAQGVDFVCWESVLRRIAATPFFEDLGWGFPVLKLRNVHFFDDTSALDSEANESFLMKRLADKFKQYVTSDAPLRERPQRDVTKAKSHRSNNLLEQCIVTQRNIDGLGLLYGTYVDCIGGDGKYVQLKANLVGFELQMPRLMDWWVKAYLNGFGSTVVGQIDNDGFIVEVNRLQTSVMLKDKQHSSESAAISFLSAVLHEVKKRLEDAKEMEQYMVEYSPHAKTVSIRKLAKSQRIKFLPDYFAHHFR